MNIRSSCIFLLQM